MRRLWLGMTAALIALAVLTVPHAASVQGAAPNKKVCKTVVRKVHGKKKRVKVCHTVKPKPLGDVSGDAQNLNDFMALGIILGSGDFFGFENATDTFLAPAHFKVQWSVNCQQDAGGGTLAFFYVVGYDGKYQPEELYTAYDAGAKSGVTNIDTTTQKRWAFVASDADKQACTYHLTALRLS